MSDAPADNPDIVQVSAQGAPGGAGLSGAMGTFQQSLSSNIIIVTAASVYVASKILWNALFRQKKSKADKSAEKDIPQSADEEATEEEIKEERTFCSNLQSVGATAI